MHLNAMLNSNTSCNVSITAVFETGNFSKSSGWMGWDESQWFMVDLADHSGSYPDFDHILITVISIMSGSYPDYGYIDHILITVIWIIS